MVVAYRTRQLLKSSKYVAASGLPFSTYIPVYRNSFKLSRRGTDNTEQNSLVRLTCACRRFQCTDYFQSRREAKAAKLSPQEVMFVTTLVLAERPHRQRRVLGVFTNKIYESPDLQKKYDEVVKQVQALAEVQIGADILALLDTNLETVLKAEGLNNESDSAVDASDSIKADNLDDQIEDNMNSEKNVDDDSESVKVPLSSSVQELDEEITVDTNTEDSFGESESTEGSLTFPVEAESKPDEGKLEDSEKGADEGNLGFDIAAAGSPIFPEPDGDEVEDSEKEADAGNLAVDIAAAGTLIFPVGAESKPDEVEVEDSEKEAQEADVGNLGVDIAAGSLVFPVEADSKPDEVKVEDSEEEVYAGNLDVDIAALADTNDPESMKNVLVSIENDLNEIQADAEMLFYARTLVSAVTNLFVNLLSKAVYIIIGLILPFPLNLLFGWIIDIFVN